MPKIDANKIAAIICGRGECVCGYDCGHANKVPHSIPLIGTNPTCPLARFHVEPDTRSFWERVSAGDTVSVTFNDCWTFCAEHCEHAEVRADGDIVLKDFETVCIDCPVHQAREAISESEAESRLS